MGVSAHRLHRHLEYPTVADAVIETAALYAQLLRWLEMSSKIQTRKRDHDDRALSLRPDGDGRWCLRSQCLLSLRMEAP
jgi:hypothetical protein